MNRSRLPALALVLALSSLSARAETTSAGTPSFGDYPHLQPMQALNGPGPGPGDGNDDDAPLDVPADAKTGYCRNVGNLASFQDKLDSSENLLGFTNAGGLLNKGVCWWHSRFTRAATYLAIYDPSKSEPTQDQVNGLVRNILRNKVAAIPFYSNLKEFSTRAQDKIQKALNTEQVTQGIGEFEWVDALGAKAKDPDKLKQTMDKLNDEVNGADKKIVFQVHHMDGGSHSWLVYHMQSNGNGYAISYIDSNETQPQTYNYHYGDASLTGSFGDFVPATHNDGELAKIRSNMQKFCSAR